MSSLKSSPRDGRVCTTGAGSGSSISPSKLTRFPEPFAPAPAALGALGAFFSFGGLGSFGASGCTEVFPADHKHFVIIRKGVRLDQHQLPEDHIHFVIRKGASLVQHYLEDEAQEHRAILEDSADHALHTYAAR